MIKKCNANQCPKCLRVKKFGKFQTLTNHEMETLKMSCDIINVIEETCSDCLEGIEFHGQGCA